MHVKKGDKVVVLAGKDKGKTGEVVLALPGKNKVVVSGVNKVKKHERARTQNGKGQTVEKEMPLHVSNVALASGEKKASKKKS
jgi:large subunit ribosomal protein L24